MSARRGTAYTTAPSSVYDQLDVTNCQKTPPESVQSRAKTKFINFQNSVRLAILRLMKPSLRAIRSVGVEFANRLHAMITIFASITAAVLVTLSLWLTTISSWWWLLCAPIIVISFIAAVLLVILKLIIHSLTPIRTYTQNKQTRAFVDKLERLSETAQTPKIILLFRIVRDIIKPRERGFIASISGDTTSLKNDFISLSKSFED